MNNVFEALSRRQIRYALFRIKESVCKEVYYSREDGKEPRRVVELRAKSKPPFKTGEWRKVLRGWGFDLSEKISKGVLEDIKEHYSSQEWFTGFENFSEPTGIFQAWDIGIDDDETMKTRPEKAWLFGKSRYTVVLRGGRRDGKTLIEQVAAIETKEMQ